MWSVLLPPGEVLFLAHILRRKYELYESTSNKKAFPRMLRNESV